MSAQLKFLTSSLRKSLQRFSWHMIGDSEDNNGKSRSEKLITLATLKWISKHGYTVKSETHIIKFRADANFF